MTRFRITSRERLAKAAGPAATPDIVATADGVPAGSRTPVLTLRGFGGQVVTPLSL